LTAQSGELPAEYWRWQLVQWYGWTLDEIDALSLGDFAECLAVREGMAKAANSEVNKGR